MDFLTKKNFKKFMIFSHNKIYKTEVIQLKLKQKLCITMKQLTKLLNILFYNLKKGKIKNNIN